ncbi:MAG: bifunctional riboflavin kinase/FAD synthetase [Nitrospirota bacterium]
MEIIKTLDQTLSFPNPVVTIGNFDGVHRGHQKIFRRVVEKAREIGGTPIAITFTPHPVRVLAPERGLKLINTLEDKRELIARTGIEALICISFDREFARTEPDSFIRDVLVEKLGACWVIVGHSYSFGKGKKGTTAMLRLRGKKYGFKVSVVRYATVTGDVVSSSRIRSLVLRGRVCETARMLGRAYHINGTVIKGAGRGGPLLHTPTANLLTPNELIPKEGVYAVRVSLSEPAAGDCMPAGAGTPVRVCDGVANIGANPTFGDTGMSCEVHLFDFNRNLVGEAIRLHFIDWIRDERKFSGARELEEHIKRDIETSREILARKTPPLYL